MKIKLAQIMKRVKKKGFTDLEVRDLLKEDNLLKKGIQWLSIDAFEYELNRILKEKENQKGGKGK